MLILTTTLKSFVSGHAGPYNYFLCIYGQDVHSAHHLSYYVFYNVIFYFSLLERDKMADWMNQGSLIFIFYFCMFVTKTSILQAISLFRSVISLTFPSISINMRK